MPGLDKEGILERTNGPIKDLDTDDRTFEIYLSKQQPNGHYHAWLVQ